MALWFTNSLFRTKSFGFRSLLPPLISLPTTTTRTVFAFNRHPNGKSQTTPELTTIPPPKRPKDDKKSKPKTSTMFEKVKIFLNIWNHKLDIDGLRSTIKNLTPSPLNVFAEEAHKLEKQLGEAATGNAFLVQASDRFDGSSEEFNADTLRVILQMNAVLMFGGQMPVIKVGNQFAKPRLDTSKEKNSVKLDSLNGDASDQRLIKAYHPRTGGYAAMQRVAQWDLDFMENSEHGDRYRELTSQVDKALGFMLAAGHTVDHPTNFWTSHEYFPYERSLITYKDSTSSLSYDCSSHFLWVGERTCQLDGAHVEFLRGIANPLGIKVSDKMDPKELVKLIGILNPENKPGRITIITRMGAENIKLKLPNIVREVKNVGQIVTWVTDPDPMPHNTIKTSSNLHPFDAIRAEVRSFFDVHEQEGTYPGGVHLKMTGQSKTEVNSGSRTTTFDNTHCDPSLNASQALELAFIVAERLQKQRITTRPTT